MDENCNVETVLPDIKEIVIKGVSYSFYCKRVLEHIAQAIKDDLIEQGKRSVVTKENGEYVVWWC